MLETEFEVLKLLNENSSVSQRMISKMVGVSLGKANSLIKELVNKNYIIKQIGEGGIDYKVTSEGMKVLKENIHKAKMLRINIHEDFDFEVKEAVILAAGKRSDFDIPVSLLDIGDITLIDRTINILKNNGIEKIVIISGYKNELFDSLKAKYSNIHIVVNDNYVNTGTMASVVSAKDVIENDFILIESDLIFEERAISELKKNSNRDCILLSKVSGSNDEAFVEIRDGYLFKIAKDIHQLNSIHGEVVGITKISYKLFNLMLEEYNRNTNPYINYEYTLLDVARNYNVGYIRIDDLIWGEIDTIEQYDKMINITYPKILTVK